ncbi:MAG: PLP-dependent transferase [Opitutae bacterium]|nr:PLP-dependent transferase [Opitutae bacterium]
MAAFSPRPLGERIPGALHSVSCSLPTMDDIIGYEEKRPATLARMKAGYPRFFLHPLVEEVRALAAEETKHPVASVWPVISACVGRALVRQLGEGEVRAVLGGAVQAVMHRPETGLATRARHYLQHTGGFLGSRAAEDVLVRTGHRAAAAPEELWPGDAEAEVQRVLQGLFAGTKAEDRRLAASGMTAVHAAFRAISEVQAPRGRTAWLQLGWLYLDTIQVLKKFTPDPPRDYIYQRDVLDLAGLEKTFQQHGARLAGLIMEAPTNPLVQTPDVAAVAALARKHGVRVVVDPAISSPFNVDVLPHADAVVCSLTKYATHAGDVMVGLAVVNPAGPDAAALRAGLDRWIEPPYARDLARLAAQIGRAAEVVARINANTARVAAFLTAHPKVKWVAWAGQPRCIENYRRIARGPEAWGGVISFAVRGPVAPFYDEVRLAKGPSFGMSTTLLCPYVFLAHYDLVHTPEGKAELAASGLEPELLRLAVGAEPAEEIIAELARALG